MALYVVLEAESLQGDFYVKLGMEAENKSGDL